MIFTLPNQFRLGKGDTISLLCPCIFLKALVFSPFCFYNSIMQSRIGELSRYQFSRKCRKALDTCKNSGTNQHSAFSIQHNVASDSVLSQNQISSPLCSAPHPSTLKKYTSAKNNSIYWHSFSLFSIGARLRCRHFSTLSLFAHSILKGLVGRISRVPHNEEWGCQKTNQLLRHPYRPYIKLSKSGECYES